MNILLVYDYSLKVEKILRSHFLTKDKVYLFPLTSKTNILRRLEEFIRNAGTHAEILNSTKIINEISEQLRDEYIHGVARIPKRVNYNSKNLIELFDIGDFTSLWWFSLISEKNTFKSDAFNKLIQLHAIIQTLERQSIGEILFGCSSDKLRKATIKYAKTNRIKIAILPVDRKQSLKRRFMDCQYMFYIKHLLILFHFAITNMIKTIQIKKKMVSLKRRLDLKRSLMIITYYPNLDISLAEKGIFKNAYCGQLQETQVFKDLKVPWIALYVPQKSISLKKALSYAADFIKKGEIFYFLEEFSSIKIQLLVLAKMLHTGLKFKKYEQNIRRANQLNGYSCYDIFKDDWYASFVGHAGYSGILYYNIFKNLLNKIKAEKCMYFCEMQAWEKALICAKKDLRSNVELIAYQHATISRMLLNYFNDPSEIKNEKKYSYPKPDKLVCNGLIPYEYMKDCGWPEGRLDIAEAIRYDHLKNLKQENLDKKKDVALIICSINAEESNAIISIVEDAFAEDNDVDIWIKPHPFLDMKRVIEISNNFKGDKRITTRNDDIKALCLESKVVIVGESSVSLQAMALGCHVVIVKVPEIMCMSPLKQIESNLISSVNSADELRREVKRLIKIKKDMIKVGDEASVIINKFFLLNENNKFPERLVNLLGIN